MVRLVTTAGTTANSSLHLSSFTPAGELLIRLRVDTVKYWTLENATVLYTPDGTHVGAPFQRRCVFDYDPTVVHERSCHGVCVGS